MNSASPAAAAKDELTAWIVDEEENVAIAGFAVILPGEIERLFVPVFTSTEEAETWGSQLNAAEHAELIELQLGVPQ